MPKTKQQKREEAAERQAHYDSLTTEQKIALAKQRRGWSKKELDRLTAKPPVPVAATEAKALGMKRMPDGTVREKRGRK